MTNYIDDTRAWITSRAGIIDSHVYDGQVCYITDLLYMGIISTLLCSAMFLFSSCTNHDDVVIYSIEHDESDVIKQPLILYCQCSPLLMKVKLINMNNNKAPDYALILEIVTISIQ